MPEVTYHSKSQLWEYPDGSFSNVLDMNKLPPSTIVKHNRTPFHSPRANMSGEEYVRRYYAPGHHEKAENPKQGVAVKMPKVAKGETKKKRGRPAGSKNKTIKVKSVVEKPKKTQPQSGFTIKIGGEEV